MESDKQTYSDLPPLIPVKGECYNLTKRIVSELYRKELSHVIFHVWLDCLYELDALLWTQINKALEPLLCSGKKRIEIPMRNIFIVAHRRAVDGTLQPGGSCYILIEEHAVKKIGHFNDLITKFKIHMQPVQLPLLRTQLKDRETLIMKDGFIDALNTVPKKALERQCKSVLPNVKPSQNSLPVIVKPLPPFYSNSQMYSAKPQTIASASEETKKEIYPQNTLQIVHPSKSNYNLPSVKEKSPQASKQAKAGKQPAPVAKKSKKVARLVAGLEYKGPEEKLLTKMEGSDQQLSFVSETLPYLKKLGDIVIKLENIPITTVNTRIHMFNLMMGTYSITAPQVIGSKKGVLKDSMNLRVVIKSNNPDVGRLLEKNNLKCFNESVLKVEKTDWHELEIFLLKNHDCICRFE